MSHGDDHLAILWEGTSLTLISGHLHLELDLKCELNQWFSRCTPRASMANSESFKLHVKIVCCFVSGLYIGVLQLDFI